MLGNQLHFMNNFIIKDIFPFHHLFPENEIISYIFKVLLQKIE